MNIALLLATFNGGKFLSEQLDSLLHQSFTQFEIYIRDDGSTDNTLSIIKEYETNYKNIHYLYDSVNHRGPGRSFMWLLENVEADLFLFCDQDDVWQPNKVQELVSHILQYDINIPCLVHSDATVVDENLNILHQSFWKMMRKRPELSGNINYLCAYPCITGCTMIINNMAKKIGLKNYNGMIHDKWLAFKIVSSGGTIGYIDKPLMYYRQHQGNAIGARAQSLISRILNIRTSIVGNLELYQQIKEFIPMSKPLYIYNKLKYLILRNI